MSNNASPSINIDKFLESMSRANCNSKKELTGVLKPYHAAARWIPLTINPFVGLTRMIYSGLEIEGVDDEEYTEEDQLLHDMVMSLVPGFRDVITMFCESPADLDMFINLLNKWSNEARHEDTGSIKNAALEYIPRDPSVDTINPPITRNQGKSIRGFNHVATARLLCPFRDLVKLGIRAELVP